MRLRAMKWARRESFCLGWAAIGIYLFFIRFFLGLGARAATRGVLFIFAAAFSVGLALAQMAN